VDEEFKRIDILVNSSAMPIMRLENIEIANEILKDNNNEESEVPIQEKFIWFGEFEDCLN